jgi:hypothetical protein
MGQWRKVLEKTEAVVSGKFNKDNNGYAYVLILKGFTYNGPSLRILF